MSSVQSKPRERGIAYCPELVRAIREGRKTQTRRPIKWVKHTLCPGSINLNFSGLELGPYATGAPQFGWVLRSRDGNGCWNDRTFPARCPYGGPGDLLWIKERVTVTGRSANGFRVSAGAGDDRFFRWEEFPHRVPQEGKTFSRAVPKLLARTWLEIVNVRAERLRGISREDAIAEGVEPVDFHETWISAWRDYSGDLVCVADPRESFQTLWDSIYAADDDRSWSSNPCVWVIEFKLAESREPKAESRS